MSRDYTHLLRLPAQRLSGEATMRVANTVERSHHGQQLHGVMPVN